MLITVPESTWHINYMKLSLSLLISFICKCDKQDPELGSNNPEKKNISILQIRKKKVDLPQIAQLVSGKTSYSKSGARILDYIRFVAFIIRYFEKKIKKNLLTANH